ncbi:S4 domain-containing protein, partial [Acinetobacter baumannii]
MKDLARFSRGASESAAAAPASRSEAASQNLPQVQLLTISDEEAGQRIDNFLLRICKGVPKSHIYRVLRSGEVRVNKGRIDQTYRLAEGDVVRVPPIRVAEKQEQVVPGA